MSKNSANLARSITWNNSKQSYYTTRFLVDRKLQNDCFRAYAYFRWVDDVIDISAESQEERIAFIKRQKGLINLLYKNQRPQDLTPEEEMIADLITHDKGKNSGLQSFIRNFLAVIEFDAYRRGSLINEAELNWYSSSLGKSVTDAIQYFIKNGHPYPDGKNRYLAATAAHITHMLRDMIHDLEEGYVNIPDEFLELYQIRPSEIKNPHFRIWVRERVILAREYFQQGKCYLDGLEVLRCKLAGYWYCARFESVLDIIEQDGYYINQSRLDQRRISHWLNLISLSLSVTLRHFQHFSLRGVWWLSKFKSERRQVKIN
jgi:phytoene/squalene synthetase